MTDVNQYIIPGKIVIEEVVKKEYNIVNLVAPSLKPFAKTADYNADIKVKLGTEKIELKLGRNGQIIENKTQYSKTDTSFMDILRLFKQVALNKLGKNTNPVSIDYKGLAPEVVAEAEAVKQGYNKVFAAYIGQLNNIPKEQVKTETIKRTLTINQDGSIDDKL
jgi:hypothetical protein